MFSFIVQITMHILTKLAPNIYFESKYTHKKLFRKVLKINPYLSESFQQIGFNFYNKRIQRFI